MDGNFPITNRPGCKEIAFALASPLSTGVYRNISDCGAPPGCSLRYDNVTRLYGPTWNFATGCNADRNCTETDQCVCYKACPRLTEVRREYSTSLEMITPPTRQLFNTSGTIISARGENLECFLFDPFESAASPGLPTTVAHDYMDATGK
jgi:hypothetical protein